MQNFVKIWNKATFRCLIDREGCPHCKEKRFSYRDILPADLIETWQLSEALTRQINRREGMSCENCGQSLRVRMLSWTLQHLFPSVENLSVLHLNTINDFSEMLVSSDAVVNTTYLPCEMLGAEVGGLSNQDVEQLTFKDERFDLVIHSETLEHVFDPGLALREVHRVLKPGGVQIYTIPLLLWRRTRQRMQRLPDQTIKNLLPPSYHGLESDYPVVWEFGGDFFALRNGHIEAVFFDNFFSNPTVFAIVERKAL